MSASFGILREVVIFFDGNDLIFILLTGRQKWSLLEGAPTVGICFMHVHKK